MYVCMYVYIYIYIVQAFKFTDEGHDTASEGEQGKTDECAEGKKGKKCGDESSQERGGMASGGDHSAAIDYIVGWDPEHNNAWKMDHNGKYRDFATEIKTDGAAEDPVVAVFACGYTCGIPNYTVGDFLASKADGDQPGSSKVDGDEPGHKEVDGDQPGSSKGLKSPYFHGRLSTGGLVSLKDRRNGGVLFVALTCPEGQVAQCRGDHFGSLDQTVAALTPLANDYARGVLTRVELKKELERIKKEKEKEVGITTKEEKKIVKQEKAEKDKTGKQPPDSSAAMPIKKEVNKKRTRDDEDTQLFDDEDTLPWGLDEDVEMMFTSTRTATDASERE